MISLVMAVLHLWCWIRRWYSLWSVQSAGYCWSERWRNLHCCRFLHRWRLWCYCSVDQKEGKEHFYTNKPYKHKTLFYFLFLCMTELDLPVQRLLPRRQRGNPLTVLRAETWTSDRSAARQRGRSSFLCWRGRTERARRRRASLTYTQW